MLFTENIKIYATRSEELRRALKTTINCSAGINFKFFKQISKFSAVWLQWFCPMEEQNSVAVFQ